jgi:2-polyprenyl-6-hydroxyphenyl methylase/3-demethylubiquinone-9 3-methyltransferase
MKGSTSCRRFCWLQVNFSYGHLAVTRYGSGYDRNGSVSVIGTVKARVGHELDPIANAIPLDRRCGGRSRRRATPGTQVVAVFRLPARLECKYLSQLRRTKMVSKNTICLWYDGTALDAAKFYAETFPDSAVGAVHRAPGDYPAGKQGDVLTVEFTVMGIPCLGLNGGPAFKHNEAFSFQVATDNQAETDRLWDAIVGNGGQESACGWCKDKWGLSWQITPRALTAAIVDPDRAAAKRAFEAMMGMRKIDIAAIEAARRG